MSRHWLLSTTALALALNTGAPLPSVASYAARSEHIAPASAAELRLAQNEAGSPKADDVTSDGQDQAPTENLGENNFATDLKAEAAADAEQAADAEPEVEAAAKAKAKVEQEEAAEVAKEEAEYPAPAAEAATNAQRGAEDAALIEAQAQQKKAEERAARADAEAIDAHTETQDAIESQADSSPAVQGQADAEVAEAKTHEAAAKQEQEAAAKALAEANAKEKQAEADQKAQDEAGQQDKAGQQDEAGQEVTPAAEADAAAPDAAQEVAPTAEPTTPEQTPAPEASPEKASEGASDTTGANAPADAAPKNEMGDAARQISAEEQASAAEAADASASTAAAASDAGEVINTQEGTVTKEQARASNEEFDTTASGKQTPEATTRKKDNDLLKAVGIAAAAGLGAYAVGKLLDNGGKVVSNTGDRAVVQEPSGAYRVIKDDDILLRRPGSQVQTQTYSDGSTRSTVTEADGSSTVTVRAVDGRVLRRTRVLADGQNVVLFDDTRNFERVDVSKLKQADQAAAARNYDYSTQDVDQLRMALSAANGQLPDRSFSLNQIRGITAVRHLVPMIALDAINFKTGSSVIEASEAQSLAALGNAMREAIQQDPAQVFLVEGHTDTVGAASYNLALSDRRAESVALALTEYFNVPPANMIVQGYGESDLRVNQTGDVRANRRGAVRNITPLLGQAR